MDGVSQRLAYEYVVGQTTSRTVNASIEGGIQRFIRGQQARTVLYLADERLKLSCRDEEYCFFLGFSSGTERLQWKSVNTSEKNAVIQGASWSDVLYKDNLYLTTIDWDKWKISCSPEDALLRVYHAFLSTSPEFEMVVNEDYNQILDEVGRALDLFDAQAFKIAERLENGMNVAKLAADNPLQKRMFEDMQWNLIEAKKHLLRWTREGSKESGVKAREALEELRSKLEAAKYAEEKISELGFDPDQFLSNFQITKVSKDRVELVWKKSG